jgi:hypothetical protein
MGALVVSALTAVGCGSSGGNDQSGFGPPGDDGGDITSDATTTVPGFVFDSGIASDGGGSKCTPRTCAQAGANCGPIADGCGGKIDCGSCTAPQTCGGGGTPYVCGGSAACVPKDCSTLGVNCGDQGDGCGNVIHCGNCTPPQTCGGGGTPSHCGGTQGCVPITQCPAGMDCGYWADGCGGVITCGGNAGKCTGGQICGGAGQPNVCGTNPALGDGGSGSGDGGAGDSGLCTPLSKGVACKGIGCGLASDGCGGTIDCGDCTSPDTCGGGGTPYQCGHPACVPLKTCPPSQTCGTIGDGCGGTISCGTCTSPDTCGGGGTPYQCGHPACTPATTCPPNVNCGPWPDGCGGMIPGGCGKCTSPAICGGSGTPSVCGDGTDGGPLCQGLQCNIPNCDSGTTTISGKIYDPAGKNALYNVVVYIPNGTPTGFTHGPTCDSCGSLYTGDPLVATTTDTSGAFTLSGVPVPPSGTVPLVIQIGKWRRQTTVSGLKKCQPNPQPDGSLRLPGKQSATDDLPQIAISTGGADSMECLFQRIGFDPSEYQDGAGGSGHLHIFQGTAATTVPNAAVMSSNTPRSFDSLYDQYGDLTAYDILILSCEGHETKSDDQGDPLTQTSLDALHKYATNGGRVFASHFHYAWFDVAPYGNENLATWTPGANAMNTNGNDYVNASVVTTLADGGTFVRGKAMKTWLGNVGALNTSSPKGELNITEPKHNADVGSSNEPPSQPWLVADNSSSVPGATEYFSFDTPTDAPMTDAGVPAYCGRVVYSDLHVGSASGDYSGFQPGDQPVVPTDCATGDLSAQEKALEFMLMDLSSCVSSDSNLPVPNPKCTPAKACPAGIVCGTWPDGCGGSIPCGACDAGTCINGACVTACQKLTCGQQNIQCGPAGDGCGGTIQNGCGSCPSGQVCQGGTCITPQCNPQPCPSNVKCGPAGDGCGGTQSCGSCGPGQSCGGGGQPGVCGAADANACNPLTCQQQNIKCGPAGDGCGNLIDCGPCPAGQTCGGGGQPGVCGAPSCTPLTCASANANCGQVADGCGGLTPSCGTCTGNATCGGGGVANQCGTPNCTPLTCKQIGADCGPAGDGCGGVLDCGTCTPPQTCGGGGVPSQCGGGVK